MINFEKKNLNYIKSINKDFYKRVIKEKKEGNEKIEIKNRDNFIIKQGSRIFLAYPDKKEKEVIDNVVKNVNCFDNDVTVIIGIGNGYMLKTLLNKGGKKHIIILVEPILKLLINAFKNYDYVQYLRNGNLLIVTTKEDLISIFQFIELNKIIEGWNLLVESYTSTLINEYDEIKKTASNTISSILCNVGTITGAGAIIAENDIKNLPYIIKHRGVAELKNLYKGKPAIIISSAPTVQKLLPQLLDEKIRENIIIIALAQMLRPLLAYGIKPDFICTVDYGAVNYEHFDNLWYVKDIPLIALNRTYAPILENWKGTKFIVTGWNPGFEDTIVGLLQKKGHLEQGGSVTHMGIGLAIHLGCNQIIMIGFSCAYGEDGLSHIPLVDANGKINFKDNGTLDWDVTDPNSSLKDKTHSMGSIIYVDGYLGGKVPTNMGLASFITSAEAIFAIYPNIIFIDAGEGGAKKKGAIQYSLKEALRKYAIKKIDKTKINKYLSLVDDYEKEIEEAKKMLNYEIGIFNDVIDNCEKAINPLNKILKEKNTIKLNLLLNENEKYANISYEAAKKSNLLSLHIYKTSREIHSRELKVSGKKLHLEKNKNNLKIRVKRSKLILSEAKKSAIKLKEIYQDVLKQLNNPEIHLKKDAPEIIINPDTWTKLIENGNWARPLLEAKYILKNKYKYIDNDEIIVRACNTINDCNILKLKSIDDSNNSEDLTDLIEFNKFVEQSQKAGREEKDFKKALLLLRKANKLFPKDINCLWGLATTYHQLEMIKESKKMYNKLIELEPKNLRYKYELGQVVLQEDIEKGIKIIEDVMKETSQFDHFYIRLAELELGLFKQEKNNFVAEVNENNICTSIITPEQLHLEKAKSNIEKYLSRFPDSSEGKSLLSNINLLI